MNTFKSALFLSVNFFLVAVLALGGCGSDSGQEAAEEPADANPYTLTEPDQPLTAQSSLDYHGQHEGVLPCADCEGIRTTVTLMEDGTFSLEKVYLGKDDRTVHGTSGEYYWNEAGNTITLAGLSGDEPGMYYVAENRLIHLDSEGQRITGVLADMYVLQKKPE